MTDAPVLIFPGDFGPTCDKCEHAEFVSGFNIHGCKIKRLIIRNYYQAAWCWYYNKKKTDNQGDDRNEIR